MVCPLKGRLFLCQLKIKKVFRSWVEISRPFKTHGTVAGRNLKTLNEQAAVVQDLCQRDRDEPKASKNPFQSVQSVAFVFYPVALVDDRKAKQMIRINIILSIYRFKFFLSLTHTFRSNSGSLPKFNNKPTSISVAFR